MQTLVCTPLCVQAQLGCTCPQYATVCTCPQYATSYALLCTFMHMPAIRNCVHMFAIRNHLYIYGACLRTRSFRLRVDTLRVDTLLKTFVTSRQLQTNVRLLKTFVTGVIYPREARGNANLLHTSGFYRAAGPAAASDGPVAP